MKYGGFRLSPESQDVPMLHIGILAYPRNSVGKSRELGPILKCEGDIVMEDNKKKRNKWLAVRLNEDELSLINSKLATTTERKLATYARKVLLAGPVTIVQRDGSLDEFLALLVRLQKDLNGVTNNYNQMLHKLHLLRTESDINAWVMLYESEKKILFSCIAEMKELIKAGAKQWLR